MIIKPLKQQKTTVLPLPVKPGTVEEWEEQVFRNAAYFTVAMKNDVGPPARIEYDDFSKACLVAWNNPRALVYAVTKEGRSAVLVRDLWAHYLTIWKQLKGIST